MGRWGGQFQLLSLLQFESENEKRPKTKRDELALLGSHCKQFTFRVFGATYINFHIGEQLFGHLPSFVSRPLLSLFLHHLYKISAGPKNIQERHSHV